MAQPKNVRKKKQHATDRRDGGSKKREWLLLGIILLLTLLLFAPTASYDFVNWDDDVNVTQNMNVQNLNSSSLKAMFSTTVIGGYTPLTTLSFALEHHFFGMNPRVYHINNILLHLVCTVMVFLLMKHLGMSLFVTLTVTLLFGIHPMRIESVAWITERKDMLYALFYFGAALSYIRFRKTTGWRFYFISLSLFIFSLLSKIQAVSLPLTLILIDYLSDKKFEVRQLKNKIPFFALSLATGLAGIYLLRQAGSLETGTILPVYQRIFIGSYSLLIYVVKSVIPYEMSAIYPFPAHLSAMHYLSLPAAVLITFIIWKLKKYRAEIVFGTLFFFVNVVFVLQIIGAGQGYMADRFTYVGYTGLFIAFAVIFENRMGVKWKNAAYTVGAIWIFILAVVTYNRVQVWENTETLFSDVIRKYPRVAVAHNNMGRYYREQNHYDKAIASYNQALEINPEGYNTYSNRGKAYFDLGRMDEALRDFNRSIEINGEYVEARSNRGAAYAATGNFEAALGDLDIALNLEPNNTNALSNRSLTWYSMSNFGKAVEDITEFLRYKPNDANMLNLRSLCYNQMNRDQEALADLNRALQLMPAQGIFWQNRSFLLNKMGNRQGALSDIRQAEALGEKADPGYLQMLQQ